MLDHVIVLVLSVKIEFCSAPTSALSSNALHFLIRMECWESIRRPIDTAVRNVLWATVTLVRRPKVGKKNELNYCKDVILVASS